MEVQQETLRDKSAGKTEALVLELDLRRLVDLTQSETDPVSWDDLSVLWAAPADPRLRGFIGA